MFGKKWIKLKMIWAILRGRPVAYKLEIDGTITLTRKGCVVQCRINSKDKTRWIFYKKNV